MTQEPNRRTFIRNSLAASMGAAISSSASASNSAGEKELPAPASLSTLPMGKIGDLSVSRLLLGGNLLTHYTHSRDLKYVYTLAQHYNTVEKILETMALAEAHGINTLVIHTAPGVMDFLQKYRYERGGKIQWIICPTAPIDDTLEEYRKQVKEIVDNGVDAVYLWGVRGDQLIKEGRIDLIEKTVQIARELGVPSGVGAHDLKVIQECESKGIETDFYIKTLHHHQYPTAPKPEEIKGIYSEIPGYWCNNPAETVELMNGVSKPWIAYKVMAAGAIPPDNAFQYAFDSGADFVLAGMFDFEIGEDVRIANEVLKKVDRQRKWMG